MVKSVVYSNTIFKNLTAPPDIEEDHQILGDGGPLGQCFRKLISNPDSTIYYSIWQFILEWYCSWEETGLKGFCITSERKGRIAICSGNSACRLEVGRWIYCINIIYGSQAKTAPSLG